MSIYYSKYDLNTYRTTPYFHAHIPTDYPITWVLIKSRAFRRLPPRLRELSVLAKRWFTRVYGSLADDGSGWDIDKWYNERGRELDPRTGRALSMEEINALWAEPNLELADFKVRDIPEPKGGWADPDTWEEPPPPPEEPSEEEGPSREKLLSDITSHGRKRVAKEYGIPIDELPTEDSALSVIDPLGNVHDARGRFAGQSAVEKAAYLPTLDRKARSQLLADHNKAAIRDIQHHLGHPMTGRKRDLLDALDEAPTKPATPVTPVAGGNGHHDAVARAVSTLGAATGGLVHLADLAEHTGLSTIDLQTVVQDMRRQGVLTATPAEGRHGHRDRDHVYGIKEGNQLLTYVSLRDAALSTDSQGHQHRGRGEGGGQFTGTEGGGTGKVEFPNSVKRGGVIYESTGRAGKNIKTGEPSQEYESNDGDAIWVKESDVKKSSGVAPDKYKHIAEYANADPSEVDKLVAQQVEKLSLLARHAGKKFNPSNYELKELPLSAVKPSQTGEDYDNDSSRELAKHIGKFGSSGRAEDYAPAIVDENMKILDGNHRHAARAIAGRKTIPVLVPRKE